MMTKTQIGNDLDAARAYEDFLDGDRAHLLSSIGTTRRVYLISGIVYKVERDSSEGYGTNAYEFEIAESIRPLLPEGYVIPDMTMFGNVLAMEYIEGVETGECFDRSCGETCLGDHVCFSDETSDALRAAGWLDQAIGNAIIRGDITYIIDLG